MMLRPTALAVAAALALGTPAALAAPQTTPTVEVQITAPVAANADLDSSYAQREKTDAKTVGDYQGGSTIVIGISGGALIVILLIILILI